MMLGIEHKNLASLFKGLAHKENPTSIFLKLPNHSRNKKVSVLLQPREI